MMPAFSALLIYPASSATQIGRVDRDLVDTGEKDSIEPCRECPHCRQKYQRQVALDMAESSLLFINENYPGSEVRKLGGLAMIIEAIGLMGFWKKSELREEGKQAANQTISAIQESGEDINDDLSGEVINKHLMFGYSALQFFSEADNTNTRDGYEMALHYLEKARDSDKSEGDEMSVKALEALMDSIKSKRDGRKETPFYDEVLTESIRAHFMRSMSEKWEKVQLQRYKPEWICLKLFIIQEYTA